MKDKLIEYDTALLAQEHGFNITTGSDCWIKTLDGKLMHNSERQQNNPLHDRTQDYYLAQPTQHQLQRWLREKHNLHVNPLPYHETADRSNEITGYYTGGIFNTLGNELYPGDDNFSNYEDALEKGLIEALKLI